MALSNRQRQRRIESAILALADLDPTISDGIEEQRNKRSIGQDEFGAESNTTVKGTGVADETWRKKENGEAKEENHLQVLVPYAFANFVADGVAVVSVNRKEGDGLLLLGSGS